MKKADTIISSAALLWAIFNCNSAFSQVANNDIALDEIVVTAERRAVSINDVPMSIQAFGGKDLATSNVKDISAIAALVPSLQIGRIGNNAVTFLRGIGTDIINVGSDSSIAFQVDGIYRSRPRDALASFLDVQRVEVLKGPQGTLYGRNAVGGAINVITNDPAPNFEGNVQFGYGNHNTVLVGGVLNVPVVADKFFIRVAAQYDRHDGYTKNLLDLPGLKKELDNQDVLQSRLKMRFIPNERVTIDITGQYSRDKGNGSAYKPEPQSQNLARDVFRGRVTPDVRTVYNNLTGSVDGKNWGIDGHVKWEISDVATLVSHTGYFNSRATEPTDRDGTDIEVSSAIARTISKSFYQDTQISYDGVGPLKLIVGVTLFDEKLQQKALISSGVPIFGAGPPSLQLITVDADVGFKNRAYGAYVQGTYNITDKLKLTAGLRYSNETKSYTSNQLILGVAPFPVPVAFDDKKKWTSITPLVRAEYDLSEHVLVYALASRGFKSGAFNTVSSSKADPLNPETVWSYEAGVKGSLLDGRMQINAAAFYSDFKNLQVQIFRTGQNIAGVENASAASIYGFELDTSAKIANAFRANLGIGLLSTKYKGFITGDPFSRNVCTVLTDPGCVNLSGNKLTRAPKVSANFGLEYEKAALSGVLTTRTEVAYKSEHFFSGFNRTTERQGSFAIVNANLSWKADEAGLLVTLYSRNLFDREYRVNQGASAPSTPTGVYWGEPRTFGAKVSYSF